MTTKFDELPSWVQSVIGAFGLFTLLGLNALKIVLLPFYRIIFAPKTTPLVVRTPDERFEGLHQLGYTFEANYVTFPNGGSSTLPRMHYVDEGPRDASRTILCLHGEPSWSFLYRKMVPVLADAGYRVIVPDFIGFGKSDKYTSPDNYTHELHMASIRQLLDHLNLDSGLILVCQDWGGLTGLSVVKDMPNAFEALVVMNTGLPNGQDATSRVMWGNALAFCVWKYTAMLFGTWLPIKYLFRFGLGFRDEVAAGYDAPFPDWQYRGGAAKWPMMVPLFRDDAVAIHMDEARKCLQSWQKPMLVMFSDMDPITAGIDKQFMKWTPTARQVDIKGAGHFLQESHGRELAQNVVKFLENKL